MSSLARLPRGFVLVTGPTGSGKSTTLASMVDLANREREDHIMTVEDCRLCGAGSRGSGRAASR